MRPHSEFFQSQWLPWLASDLGGMRPDVLVRTLSLDSDSGACSLIVRYPPGYCCVARMRLLRRSTLPDWCYISTPAR